MLVSALTDFPLEVRLFTNFITFIGSVSSLYNTKASMSYFWNLWKSLSSSPIYNANPIASAFIPNRLKAQHLVLVQQSLEILYRYNNPNH